MKLEPSRWNEDELGAMSLENIRLRYQPGSHYRVSPTTHPAGTKFVGCSAPRTLYLICGRCTITIAESSVNLCGKEFAVLPGGDYQFTVLDDSAIEFVSVWEIPEAYRQKPNDTQ